ncbi:nuclear transport factor 2 family protein [Saccharopolyspora sp. NPDC047091]|uniref:nuclear transport factor 2 family protein n=1 Tax=Saccharopolyspora sp. NPDC047091 TaxID=3155924 RepID=UPI0033C5FB54
MTDTVASANRRLVLEYIRIFYNEKDFDRARPMLTEDFANHHTGVGTGRERTIETFREQVGVPLPDFTLTVLRSIAEGDFVWTCGVVRAFPDTPSALVVDIWRVENGRLAEHWDVAQGLPSDGTAAELIAEVS